MEMNKSWPDTFHDEYVCKSQSEPTQKLAMAVETTKLKKFSHEISLILPKNHPNQHKNNQNL